MRHSKSRQIGLPGFELEDYVKESILFLRQHEPLEGYYVGFSGGKDSITTLELCRMAGVKHQPYYSCTRIDPPEMYAFIKANYPEVTWLFPKESFWSMILKKGPPFKMIRWCCNHLKKEPSNAVPLNHRIMGIRAEESFHRAKYPRVDMYRKRRKQILLKPIFYWPEWAVWEFIEARDLAYPTLYDEGFGRIGCVVCPFIMGTSSGQVANRKRQMERWPSLWKVFEHTVKRWFVEKGCKGGLRANQHITTPDDFWRIYLRGGKDE